MDLKTVSNFNKLVKYADDTSLLVPQYSSGSLEDEYQNLLHWSTVNKLKINTDKSTRPKRLFSDAPSHVILSHLPLSLGLSKSSQLSF